MRPSFLNGKRQGAPSVDFRRCPFLTNWLVYAIITIARTMAVTWCGTIGGA